MPQILCFDMAATRKINGGIELARFVFCIVIMLYHSSEVGIHACQRGRMAVSFFFLLSGFLAAKSILGRNESETFIGYGCRFFKRKLLAVQPELITFAAMYLVFQLITCYPLEKVANFGWGAFVSDILLLRMFGADFAGIEPAWYISSMFIALLLIYPLLYKRVHAFILFILGFGVLTFLAREMYLLAFYFKDTIGGIYVGNIWGVGAILLGATLYGVHKRLRNAQFRIPGWLPLSSAAGALAGSLVLMNLRQGLLHDIASTSLLCILILSLFMIPQDSACRRNERLNGIVFFLGKISLPLYLTHRYVLHELARTPGFDETLGWQITYVIAVVLVSLLVSYLAGILRSRIAKYYS